MLSEEHVLEILEAYDLTRSYRSAAALCGVDPHTVRRYVSARAAGLSLEQLSRPGVADAFAEKIDEWVRRSNGKVRADVVHAKLVAMGYPGSERTTRRVVSALKAAYRAECHRIYRPWIPEPGLWLQWDYAEGPLVEGLRVVLFCAWLAWSRYRVIIPLRDKTLPSVIAALDAAFRHLGGAPTYCLTDNEKTVTDRHIAGVAVRNPAMVSAAHYYGVTIATCVPYDPESKGGSESTVRVAKADLVPTEANLAPGYGGWMEVIDASVQAMTRFNHRVHRETLAVPADRLVGELAHLHAIPEAPYTAAFGQTRSVTWSSTFKYHGATYSVPSTWAGKVVWVRVHGEEVVAVAQTPAGLAEVARHRLVGPGQVSIDDGHYRPRRRDPLRREPTARNLAEAAFLAIGEGARRFLTEAAAAGARGIEATMADAVGLAKLSGTPMLDEALGLAAFAGRFGTDDVVSILTTRREPPKTASEDHSLQPGTGAWAGFDGPASDVEALGEDVRWQDEEDDSGPEVDDQ
jgi:transposase